MSTAHSEGRRFATVLEEIAEEIRCAVDRPRFHPSDTVVASDQVIGIITNPATKQIFFARQAIQEELMNFDDQETRIIATIGPRARAMDLPSIGRALSAPEFCEEAKELEGIRKEAFFAHAKYEVLNHLLWMSVKQDFSAQLFEFNGAVLLKKGWKVVTVKGENQLHELLEQAVEQHERGECEHHGH